MELCETEGLPLYPRCSFPGCYPYYYITNTSALICPDCANKLRLDGPDEYSDDSEIIGQDVNWETADVYCEFCNEPLEAAYPADDDDDGVDGSDTYYNEGD